MLQREIKRNISPFSFPFHMLSSNGLGLLRELIQQQTTSGNRLEQKRALQVIRRNLPPIFAARYFSNNGFDSGFFSPKGSEKTDILLSAHIDVAPAPKNLFNLRKKGDKLYGRGTFDMKGPLAALLEALAIFYRFPQHISVGLLVTSDEEKGGFDGTDFFLKTFPYRPKAVIVPDGGNNFEIVIEEKGVLNVELFHQGTAAHSARPWEGKNAAEILVKTVNKVLNRFPAGTANQWRTTAALTSLEAESQVGNVLPARARARVNFRFIQKDSPELILKTIRRLDNKVGIKAYPRGDAVKLSARAWPTPLFRAITKAHIGRLAPFVKYPSTCDARFFASRAIPTIITRPPGGGAHGEKEWVSLRGLGAFAEILVDFLKQASKKLA